MIPLGDAVNNVMAGLEAKLIEKGVIQMGALDVMKRPQTAATDLAIISENAAFMQMIERAARDPNVDVDKMERLFAMHERAVTHRAKVAYSTALANLQPDLPVVERRGQIVIRDKADQKKIIQSTPYALWEDINEAIKPLLARDGFALSFRVGQAQDGKITVTGVLSHKEGHQEETTLSLQYDSTGSKNAVQSAGSSISYGKRYVAGLLLNFTSRAPEEADDDGTKGGAKSEPDLDPSVQFYIDHAVEKMDIIETAADLKAWWDGERQTRVDLSLGKGKPGYKELFQAFSTRGKELVKIEEHA